MRPGETVLGTTLEVKPGGKGANQALAASRAGAEVRMVGCVGNDSFASQALALLSVAEIDLSHVRRMDRHTGTALIVVDAAGENMITVLPGANNRLGASALDIAPLGPDDTLIVQLETPIAGVTEAAQAARRGGARVVVNLSPASEVPQALLEAADVIVANEAEFGATLAHWGERSKTLAVGLTRFANRFDAIAVATLAERGALAATPDGKTLEIAGRTIVPLDTTGAGDSFVGYLTAALAEGLALAPALERANAAAALSCLEKGAQPAIPEAHAVDAFMAEPT